MHHTTGYIFSIVLLSAAFYQHYIIVYRTFWHAALTTANSLVPGRWIQVTTWYHHVISLTNVDPDLFHYVPLLGSYMWTWAFEKVLIVSSALMKF